MWSIGYVPDEHDDLAFPVADNKIKEESDGLMNNYSVLNEIHRKCKGFRPFFSDSKLFSNFKRTLGQRPKGNSWG